MSVENFDHHLIQSSPLFAPANVAGLDLQSRIVMAPMSRYLCPENTPHQGVTDYYTARAKGGVGLILTEGTYIAHPSAPSYTGVPYFTADTAENWSKVAASVHAHGAKIFPQLWHTGSFRTTGMAPDHALPGFGPSENTNAFTGHPEATRAMSVAEIKEVIAAYAVSAKLAQQAGFDGVELHAGHGYLIDEFFWPVTNRRTDAYGGSQENRLRFAVEILGAIRAEVGQDFPISLRFSQWKQQDYRATLAETPEELAAFLMPLSEAGVSIFHCSTRRLPEPAFPALSDKLLSGWVKEITGKPAIAVGSVGLAKAGLNTSDVSSVAPAVAAFDKGQFDLMAVGRALIAAPDWVDLQRAGQGDKATPYDKAMLDSLV